MSALAARGLRLPRLSAATVAILAGVVVVLVAGWFWLRDSSLVAIRQARISGVSGPHAAAIRGALRGTALTMTTLDVDMTRLRASVEPFRDVETLDVSTHFPHGISIRVVEQVPIAEVTAGNRTLVVDSAGTLLRSPVRADGRLPQIGVSVAPGTGRLRGTSARAVLSALAAAPWQLVGRIQRGSDTAGRGLVLSLRNGPELRFGDSSDLRAKWGAALAVLASGGSAGAAYIDVSDPQRPAAGVTVPAAPSTTATGAGTTATGAGTTAAASSTTAGGTSGTAATAATPATGG